jgi:uncharacterized protein YndB with AHSA1/START domain
MSAHTVTHDTFTIERTYPVPPARVFAAWSDPAEKRRWFGDRADEYELDFRVDGTELNRGSAGNGAVYTYAARYRDIVPDERFVYAYEMYMGDTRISVSLGTVELEPRGDGTVLRYTEQGAYLDGHDEPSQRRAGTKDLLDALGAALIAAATES